MIDYKLLSDSVEYYRNCEFEFIDTPWLVTKETSDITAPLGSDNFTVIEKNKVLVASGEQSFLYLRIKGMLPNGKYQSITPCFRNETHNILHQKTFIKNELIVIDDNLQKVQDAVVPLMEQAYNFFYKKIKHKDRLIKKVTDIGYDINYLDVELGSYGFRTFKHLKWAYGTGLAEPRFSNTLLWDTI